MASIHKEVDVKALLRAHEHQWHGAGFREKYSPELVSEGLGLPDLIVVEGRVWPG